MIIRPREIEEYLVEIMSIVPEIHKHHLTAKMGELSNIVDRLTTDEIVLVAVIPDVKSKSLTVDQIQFSNTLEFWVVQKTDYREYENNREWIGVWDKTAEVTKKVIEKMLNDKRDNACNILFDLQPSSISIFPIWHISDCNGWGVEFTLDV